jgi:Arc/MetJ-type ribon-helix-helix transcriptional regulator
MADQTITLTLSKADAEVLLGVVSSERYNTEVEAVCEAIRRQLDERLAELG